MFLIWVKLLFRAIKGYYLPIKVHPGILKVIDGHWFVAINVIRINISRFSPSGVDDYK